MTWCAGYDAETFRRHALEMRIHMAAGDCLGFSYSRDNGIPFRRPGMPSSLANGKLGIDCCTFTTYILHTVFPEARWSSKTYQQLQLAMPRDQWDAWGPMAAVEAAGVGQRVDGPVAGRWAITQAWKDGSFDDGDGVTGGHARIVRFLDEDRMLVLESTTRLNGKGPTWTQGTTWSELVKRYSVDAKALERGEAGVRVALLSED